VVRGPGRSNGLGNDRMWTRHKSCWLGPVLAGKEKEDIARDGMARLLGRRDPQR
jgi:hypothetical protein